MPTSPSIVQHALDLLEGLGPVQARSMFGGHGLYARGAMLGLIVDDELFLKTDDRTRDAFRAAGCEPWIYTGRRAPMETSYFRPPENALESAEDMLPWATRALEAALRKKRARENASRPGKRATAKRPTKLGKPRPKRSR